MFFFFWDEDLDPVGSVYNVEFYVCHIMIRRKTCQILIPDFIVAGDTRDGETVLTSEASIPQKLRREWIWSTFTKRILKKLEDVNQVKSMWIQVRSDPHSSIIYVTIIFGPGNYTCKKWNLIRSHPRGFNSKHSIPKKNENQVKSNAKWKYCGVRGNLFLAWSLQKDPECASEASLWVYAPLTGGA